MVPPPAEDVNVSLLSTTVVRKRGRPPKTPTTPVAPNFPPGSFSQGDEEPGPSTLDTSRLAVKAPRPPRKSVSPSNRADATADVTNWLLERIQVSDSPASAILKSQLMDRYEEYCVGKGTEPLIDSLVGKEDTNNSPDVRHEQIQVVTRPEDHFLPNRKNVGSTKVYLDSNKLTGSDTGNG
ncbi:hypothetical protein Fcan01_25308 [Folsomia candida]|uniref:Uncharacterized protein n=1 Tax=Folsomia candida TaxID=158441 RepID=A0A226D527_FOLCA|nr:hypothetical protein Fcan01_25308 [Folsomia candida]